MPMEYNSTKDFFAPEYFFESHHHVWDRMILSFLPKHIQSLDYDEQDLLSLQRYVKVNVRKLNC